MFIMKKSIFLTFLLLSVISGIRAAQILQPKSTNGFYFVTDFGAKGDGVAKDTPAIQKSIDACSENGGGTVCFPAGTYLCGSLHLKSNIDLHLEPGSVIKMSGDNHDFDPYETLGFKNAADKETSFFHYALICGENVENIAITGRGTIDGNRTKRGGPKSIALKLCRQVTIRDITLKNAP
jgi:polygalacturonase